jgi:drug/metabolite transporter (DMT)-like permease
MSLGVFLAVLCAALLHAGWNALIKLRAGSVRVMLVLTLVQGGLGVLIAFTRAIPEGEVWIWLLASGVFHAGYKVFLALAYEHGDLSRVYPIARGAAPLIVLVVGAMVLDDQLTEMEVIGILVLGAGILTMARGVFELGESRHLVPLALLSAVGTAGYSLVDGLGARILGDAVTFVAWLFIFDALLFTPAVVLMRGTGVFQATSAMWLRGGVAALASYGAYAIAVWAMTQTPIALVAALRESSILFAVAIGYLAFGERLDRGKLISVGMILTGIILTRV